MFETVLKLIKLQS